MSDLTKIREKVASLHLLVADDEDELRESVIKFMQKVFTNVDGAQNGEIALEMLMEDSSYDILLTDIRMPHMTGIELIKEINKTDLDIFIAVMTASPVVEGENVDACDMYMSKPVDIEKITMMLKLIIEKKGL